ncbi:MAG: 5'-methylthioadenosine/S-adenosylhomocysteine nucleosidase [Selenomonadaceae bacterium]|nr:5'-methylthioadenosine/S-adenosylhomocysteine nucleosidase [Selenomonadaceae bacterium]
MKKFLVLIIAALFFVTTPIHAQDSNVTNADAVADKINDSIEKFYVTLPQAKGKYKSRLRPILIEGAMNVETEIFVRALKNPVTYRDLNYLFVAGTYKNYPVVVVRTEQGMANAAASTALAIEKFNPVAVINQGTAGGHDPELKIGDIVIGEKTFDMFAIKTARSETGTGAELTNQELRGTYAFDEKTDTFQPHNEFFADPTLFNIALAVANAHEKFNAVSGTIGSSDAWLINMDYINFLHEKYGSSCAEMETHAAAQICHNAGVPFIGIRVLSDNAIVSNDYVPETSTTCQEFVLLVVEKYIRDVLKK